MQMDADDVLAHRVDRPAWYLAGDAITLRAAGVLIVGEAC